MEMITICASKITFSNITKIFAIFLVSCIFWLKCNSAISSAIENTYIVRKVEEILQYDMKMDKENFLKEHKNVISSASIEGLSKQDSPLFFEWFNEGEDNEGAISYYFCNRIFSDISIEFRVPLVDYEKESRRLIDRLKEKQNGRFMYAEFSIRDTISPSNKTNKSLNVTSKKPYLVWEDDSRIILLSIQKGKYGTSMKRGTILLKLLNKRNIESNISPQKFREHLTNERPEAFDRFSPILLDVLPDKLN